MRNEQRGGIMIRRETARPHDRGLPLSVSK